MFLKMKNILLKLVFKRRLLEYLLVSWALYMGFGGLWGLTEAMFPSSHPSVSGGLCFLTVSIIFLLFPRTFLSRRPLSLWRLFPLTMMSFSCLLVYLKKVWLSLGSGLLTFSMMCDSDLSGRACYLALCVFRAPGTWHTARYHILPGLSMNLWLSLFKMLVGKLWIASSIHRTWHKLSV